MLVLLPNNQTEMLMDRKILEVTWTGSGLDIIETSDLEVDSYFDENSSGMCSFSFKNRMFLVGGKGSLSGQLHFSREFESINYVSPRFKEYQIRRSPRIIRLDSMLLTLTEIP